MYQVIESIQCSTTGASERALNYFSYFPVYAFATFLTLFLIILFYIILFSSSSLLLLVLFCLRFPFYVWVSVVVHLHGLAGKTECKHKIHSIQKQALRSSVFSYTLSLALFLGAVRFLLLLVAFLFLVLFFLSSVCYYYNKLLRAESLLPLWYSLRSWNFSVPFGLSETREKRTTDKKQQHKRTKWKLNQKPKPKQRTHTHCFGYCASAELASERARARPCVLSPRHWERYGVPVDGMRKESTSEPHTWKLRMEEV